MWIYRELTEKKTLKVDIQRNNRKPPCINVGIQGYYRAFSRKKVDIQRKQRKKNPIMKVDIQRNDRKPPYISVDMQGIYRAFSRKVVDRQRIHRKVHWKNVDIPGKHKTPCMNVNIQKLQKTSQ